MPPLPYLCQMSKRRVNWTRRILSIAFLAIFLLLCGILIATIRIGDDAEFRGRLLEAMKDTTPPVIELTGGEKITVAIGDDYEEPGASAYDIDSETELISSNNINTDAEGEYSITYTATDESGNTTSVSRVVNVIRPAGRIYLTFDDGPSEHTGRLLDLLKKYGIKATFFVTGYGDDATILREYNEGHSVALHTMSHDYSYIYSSVDNYWTDLNAIKNRVENITGYSPKLMRFPGGSSNLISSYYDGGSKIMSYLVDDVTSKGFVYFDWNVDSNDAGGASSADEVYNNVINSLHYGWSSVVLQHDVKDFSIDAVERIIQFGLENGFVFDKLREHSFTAHHSVNN